MEKLLKILAAAVVIFLVYLWVTVLFRSCNSDDTGRKKVKSEMIEKTPEYEVEDEDIFDGGSEGQSESKEIDYTEVDKAFEKAKDKVAPKSESPGPQTTKKDPPNESKPALPPKENIKQAPYEIPVQTSIPKSDPNGRFMVIAGSFKEYNNAQKRVDEFKKMGFVDAEAVLTPFSDNYLAVAGRYNSKENAQKLLSALKAKKIDAYIKERK